MEAFYPKQSVHPHTYVARSIIKWKTRWNRETNIDNGIAHEQHKTFKAQTVQDSVNNENRKNLINVWIAFTLKPRVAEIGRDKSLPEV